MYQHDGIYRIKLTHEGSDPSKPSAVKLNISYARFEGYDDDRSLKLYGSQPDEETGKSNIIELTAAEANRVFKPGQLQLLRKYDKPIDTNNRWGKRPELHEDDFADAVVESDEGNEPAEDDYAVVEFVRDVNSGALDPVAAARQINRMSPDDAHEVIAAVVPKINAIRAPKLIKELDSPHTVRAALLAEQSREGGARPQLEKLIKHTLDRLITDESAVA